MRRAATEASHGPAAHPGGRHRASGRSCCSPPSARSSPSGPGVLNLGVEGMMLIGAVAGFGTAVSTGNPWLGVVLAMLAGGLLEPAPRHRHHHVPGRPGRLRPGPHVPRHRPRARAGRRARARPARSPCCRASRCRACRRSRSLGPIVFTEQSVLVYVGYLLVPAAWYWINRTRPGLNLRAVGEEPAAADALGVNVYATRYATCSWAGCSRASPAPRSRWPSSPAGSAT